MIVINIKVHYVPVVESKEDLKKRGYADAFAKALRMQSIMFYHQELHKLQFKYPAIFVSLMDCLSAESEPAVRLSDGFSEMEKAMDPLPLWKRILNYMSLVVCLVVQQWIETRRVEILIK